MPVTMLPVFLMVASLASVEGFREGSCLGYDVLCTTADYQLRRYSESVWVGINGSGIDVTRRETASLLSFFRQDNSKGMRIQLPGQTLVSLTGYRVRTVYKMLPEELWDNPPTPTNPQVFITRFPMMNVFARIIRGFPMNDANEFNRTLTTQNVPVNNSNFFVYSCLREGAAFLYLLQGQEIWFVASGRFDCPVP